MTMEFKVRPWLWLILLLVTATGIGLTYYWLVTANKTPSESSIPTPVKSTTVSPKTSVSPGVTATPETTATPTQTPPTGWKVEQNYLSSGGGAVYGGSYQVFIKESWTPRENSAFTTWPHNLIYYGDGPKCGSSAADGSYYYDDCIFYVGGSFTPMFYPGKISDSDKQIVLDSFKRL